MSRFEELKKYLRIGTAAATIAAVTASAFAGGAYAQDNDDDDDEEEDDGVEDVVVTGSRIKRSPFSSPTPVQVIDGQTSRELGLFDATEMLQTTTQASGMQIDNSFQGFVLDGGIGATSVGFRGLGAARTLVLMNGRRLAPVGIGGGPSSPDLNLIPTVMIQRVENVFDGASTIYGSDAIAGVANVILKKNIEGFEVQGSARIPETGGGKEFTVSAMWGKTFDKGFITIGGEIYERKVMTMAQHPYENECEREIYEDENGNILDPTYHYDYPTRNPDRGCILTRSINRMQINGSPFSSVWFTPGSSNIGVPNFSDDGISGSFAGYHSDYLINGLIRYDRNSDGELSTGDLNGNGIIDGDETASDWYYFDADGDGYIDVDLQDPLYSVANSPRGQEYHYVAPSRRYNIMLTGEYLIDEDSDTKFFFEGYYSRRENNSYSPGGQFFPWVSPTNPYNPCNIDTNPDGVDCYAVPEEAYYDAAGGTYTPSSAWVRPIVSVRGDRDRAEAQIYQIRAMGGISGNIDFHNGISYEAFISHSYSKGDEKRRGFNEARVNQGLNATLDGDGNVVCVDPSNGCIPLNLFSSRIMAVGGGTLTPEEEAFYFSDRTIETVIKQTMVGATFSGDLFTLPWNDTPVPIAFGGEWRKDSIASDPNDVAAEGLLWGFFNDEGSDGSRTFKEFFAETSLQLLQGYKMMEELTIDAAARWTDESYYDSAWTYSFRGLYRPVEWVTIRGTHGTSYRAPNLRERFLNGTSGFGTVSDPCYVPQAAQANDPNNPGGFVYDASGDAREQRVLDSCRANGVDPTTLGLGQSINAYSTEVKSGGATDISEETSTSSTYGFVLEQPFSDKFDLRFSMTWFDIEILNSIAEPSSAYIVGQCYNNPQVPDGSSPFCRRITRQDGGSGNYDLIDASYLNIGRNTSRGLDYNLYFSTEIEVAGKPMGISLDMNATQLKERDQEIEGVVTEFQGFTDYPEWRASATMTLAYDDFTFRWQTRFIGKGEESETSFSDTGVACRDQAGVACRAVYYTTNYDVHNMSLSWTDGKYSISGGVRNVFNTAPPKVDAGGVFSRRNVPFGVGYDLFGRSFFLTAGAKF